MAFIFELAMLNLQTLITNCVISGSKCETFSSTNLVTFQTLTSATMETRRGGGEEAEDSTTDYSSDGGSEAMSSPLKRILRGPQTR